MADRIDERSWLDTSLALEERIDALLAVMTLDEKVGQTHQVANIDPVGDAELVRSGAISSSLYASGALGGNERDEGVVADAIQEVQRVAVEESRLGIPVLFGRDVIHGHRTVFPIPLGQAAAWSEELVETGASIAAREAVPDGIAWTFAPMVDICEDARWGRIAESFGEAPVLSGRLGAAAVRGFQGILDDDEKIAATAKHFAGYGLATGGRDYETVQVGENTMRNLHLRTFKAAVEAGVQTVMASFNDVDGTPMHANKHLIREVLKGEWGFDGLVVGDWDGVGELVEHGIAADDREAARLAIEAGVDLDMVSACYSRFLADLVGTGEVSEELLDDAVRRVLRVKFRLGLFERPFVRRKGEDNAPTEETRRVARQSAARTFVLAKNDGGLLPLSKDVESLALVGPFVDEQTALMGTWVLDGQSADVVSVREAFTELLGDRLRIENGRFSDEASKLARISEVTVAVVGEYHSRSGEANSVTRLGLPAGQLEALQEIAGLGKPLVAVVHTGRPLDLSGVLAIADAVLVVWHGGVEAAHALTDVLFGDAEPGGRLPATFPRSTGHVPFSHHARRTSRLIDFADDANAGRYLDALTMPQLPFGFGMGYTDWTVGEPQLSSSEVTLGGSVVVGVEVANTGERAGRQLVQLYFGDPVADVTRPKIELADWAWVELEAGEKTVVSFELSTDAFGYHGRDMAWRVDPGEIEVMAGVHAMALRSATLTVTA